MTDTQLKPTTVQVDYTEYTITWPVPNFSNHCSRTSNSFSVYSPDYETRERNGETFIWEGRLKATNSIIGTFLHLKNSNLQSCGSFNPATVEVNVAHVIGFGNTDNNFLVQTSISQFPTKTKFKISESRGQQNMISIPDLYNREGELLKDNTLRITIKFRIYSTNSPVVRDLGHLYTSQKFADVTLVCERKSFKCHKIILAARSNVFERMFETDMKEATDSEIRIDDVEPGAMEVLLKYIYTGCMNIEEGFNWPSLLHAAEKYHLEELKSDCLEKMFDMVTPATFGVLVLNANTYNAADEFKNRLVVYREQNIALLMECESFRNALFTDPRAFYSGFEQRAMSVTSKGVELNPIISSAVLEDDHENSKPTT